MKLKDDSLMPFGEHEKKQMVNVPASYLLWLGEKIALVHVTKRSLNQKLVLKYVEDNKQVLEKQNHKK